MPDLQAISQDVPFDFAGARALAAEFRSAARELDEQAGSSRPSAAAGARAEWLGVYAAQFDQRLRVGSADGHELATAFRRAADGLDTLADAAHREQQRREDARRWEEQQNDRNWFQQMGDNVSDFFTGDDDVPPPSAPDPPPRFRSSATVSATRSG